MKNTNDITIQVKVQEYGPELYRINETGSFIRKELCTVIKTVKHVQELERPEGKYFMNSNAANKYATLLNTFIDYQEQQIKDLQEKLNTYEIEQGITMKHVQPHPIGCNVELGRVEIQDLVNGKWVQPEVKLIAKAGEWVKIIDMGDTEGQGTKDAWHLNVAYQLALGLDAKGEFDVVADSRGKKNAWYSVWDNKMKFEKVSAPMKEKPSIPYCSRTDALFTHMLEYHDLKLVDTELNDIIDIVHKNAAPIPVDIDSGVLEHIMSEEPIRTIHFEGKDIPEDTEVYYIDKGDYLIRHDRIKYYENALGEFEDSTKVYLTPKQVNARLKEEVIKKAKDYPISITIQKLRSISKPLIDYAIEEFEKDHNITYLPE